MLRILPIAPVFFLGCVPAAKPSPAAPPLEIDGLATDALKAAVDAATALPGLAALVGLFIGDETQLNDAVTAGDLDAAAGRAQSAVGLCDSAALEHVQGGRAAAVSFTGPCTLPSGVVASAGVVSAAFSGHVIQLGLSGVVADGQTWTGVVDLDSTFFPLGFIGRSPASSLFAPLFPAIVIGAGQLAIGPGADGVQRVSLPTIIVEQGFGTAGTTQGPLGPRLDGDAVCSVLGTSVEIDGLERRADACGVTATNVKAAVALECTSGDSSTTFDHDGEIDVALTPFSPGAHDAPVTTRLPHAISGHVVHIDVSAPSCP